MRHRPSNLAAVVTKKGSILAPVKNYTFHINITVYACYRQQLTGVYAHAHIGRLKEFWLVYDCRPLLCS